VTGTTGVVAEGIAHPATVSLHFDRQRRVHAEAAAAVCSCPGDALVADDGVDADAGRPHDQVRAQNFTAARRLDGDGVRANSGDFGSVAHSSASAGEGPEGLLAHGGVALGKHGVAAVDEQHLPRAQAKARRQLHASVPAPDDDNPHPHALALRFCLEGRDGVVQLLHVIELYRATSSTQIVPTSAQSA
jgi:hypothetical protein